MTIEAKIRINIFMPYTSMPLMKQEEQKIRINIISHTSNTTYETGRTENTY